MWGFLLPQREALSFIRLRIGAFRLLGFFPNHNNILTVFQIVQSQQWGIPNQKLKIEFPLSENGNLRMGREREQWGGRKKIMAKI